MLEGANLLQMSQVFMRQVFAPDRSDEFLSRRC
jgi:hypothetical protein